MANKITSEQYEHAMNDILAIYSQAENEMLLKVAKRVSKGITTEGWNESYLKQVQSMNQELTKTMGAATALVQSKVATQAKNEYSKAVNITFDDDISDYVKGQTLSVGKYMQENYGMGISKVVQNGKGFKGKNSGAYMFVDNKDSSVLHINPAMFKGKTPAQIDAMISKQSGVMHKNADLSSIIAHEYGHAIDLKMGGQQKMKDILAGKSPADAAKAISKYAGVSDDELFAEALADYYKNGEKATPFAKELGKTVESVSKAEVEKRLKDEYAPTTYGKFLDNVDIPMNLKQLVKATNNMIGDASMQVLRNANDAYKQIMGNATTGLLAGTDTRIQASQKMLNEFAAKGITTFKDKAGRNWDLGSYSEMCARTVSNHAALQGHIDRAKSTGKDLMKVSSIATTCPICASWEGVVLSISGTDAKYPSLESAQASGLFHPNCKHTLGVFIPELDGVGKSTQNTVNPRSRGQIRNTLIEQQRSNERNIRYWKKRSSVGITEVDRAKANAKVKYWQQRNLLFCEKHDLRRQYAREGVRAGNPTGPFGSSIGDITSFYKDVLGVSPQAVYKQLKIDPSQVPFEKWLKDEIQDLDELDIDKAMMKDASNKSVTPTTMYKKYIGDEPISDFAQVAPFEKGTNDFKKAYAKWLKEAVSGIGTEYKVKPKFVTVTEAIPVEDQALSATVLYKKYNGGKAPTEAYKALGGEEGTGMKYAKWIETQKKELIQNGITKQVPFANAKVEKTSKVFVQVTESIYKIKSKEVANEAAKYKQFLDDTIGSQYSAFLKVKENLDEFLKIKSEQPPGSDELTLQHKKLDLAKEKHLEMVDKKIKKTIGTSAFEDDMANLIKKHPSTVGTPLYTHMQAQIDMYAKAKQQHEYEVRQAEAKRASDRNKIHIEKRASFKEGKLVSAKEAYVELDYEGLDKMAMQAKANTLMKAERRDVLGRDMKGQNHRMGHDVRLKEGLSGSDKELGQAAQVFYDDFINTQKCKAINDACAKGYNNASPLMKKKIDAIDKVIASCEIDAPISVNRFVSSDVMDELLKGKAITDLDVGDKIFSPTFMSTTVSGHPTFEKRSVMLSIQCPKGSHVMPTLNYEEGEVTLGRDSTLEIVEIIDHSSDPKKLKHFKGTEGEFAGTEIVVRYIESGRSKNYETPTKELMDKMLAAQSKKERTPALSIHTTVESEEWVSGLSSNERRACERYTGSCYQEINNVGRFPSRVHSDTNASSYVNLTSALDNASTSSPIVVRRGLHNADIAHMLGLEGDEGKLSSLVDEINKGGYIAEDGGFLSTSPFNKGGFNKDSELIVYCPSSSRVAYVAPISPFKSEKESIIQSGGVFKIVKIEPSGAGYKVYAELLGTN